MAAVVRVQFRSIYQPTSVNCVNVFYYQYAPTGFATLADLDDLWAALNAAGRLRAMLADCMTTDMDWLLARLTYLGRTNEPPIWKEYTPSGSGGTQTPPTLPLNCTVVVRKRSTFAKRWGMGRVFVPGIRQADVTNGQVTAATSTANSLNLLLPEITLQLLGALWTWKPVLVRTGVFDGDGGPSTVTIAASAWDTIIRSQRRRELGVGI